MSDEELDQLFRALGDTTRRDILRRTLAGTHSVSALASTYEMSFAAVQKHVSVLESAGLVSKTRAGRERLVAAEPEQIARARAVLTTLEGLWRHRMNTLGDLLAEPLE